MFWKDALYDEVAMKTTFLFLVLELKRKEKENDVFVLVAIVFATEYLDYSTEKNIDTSRNHTSSNPSSQVDARTRQPAVRGSCHEKNRKSLSSAMAFEKKRPHES